MNQKHTCYIVLGMHRSGTSLVSGILSKLGVFLGREEDMLSQTVENPYGYFENNKVMSINDDILSVFGGTWDTIPILQYGWQKDVRLNSIRDRIESFIHDMQSQKAVWGIKDPRMPITLPLWQEYLPENTCYIITYRNPIEIIYSLQKRKNITAVKNFFSLWSRTYSSIQECIHNKKNIYVSYNLLHANFQREVEKFVDADPFGFLAQQYQEKKEFVVKLFDIRLYRNLDMSGYMVSDYDMSEIGFSAMMLRDASMLHDWLEKDFDKEKATYLQQIQVLENQCTYLEQQNKDIEAIQKNISTSKQDILEKMHIDQHSHDDRQQAVIARLEKIEKNYREKTFALIQLLEKKQQKELELQNLVQEKEKQIDVTMLEKDFLSQGVIEKDRYIASLQDHIQSIQLALQTTQQVLQQKENLLMHIQSNSLLAKMKNLYIRIRWALHHPLRFLKKNVWQGFPTYPQIRWVILHPLKFLKKHVWRSMPTYPQIIWAIYNPKKFFEKYFLRRKTKFLYTPLVTQKDTKHPRITVIAHIFYEDMWEEIYKRLQYIEEPFHIIITLTQGHYSKSFIKKVKNAYPDVKIFTYENQGLDILPFVKALAHVPKDTQFILKVHTKKSLYDPSMGAKWFYDLMDHVLHDEKTVNAILHNLEYSDAGMIGGSHVGALGNIFSSDEVYEPSIEKIYAHTDEQHTQYSWISGSIFWVRYDILEKIISQKFISFLEKEQPMGYVENGTVIHGLERYVGKLVYDAGRVIYEYPQNRYSYDFITLIPDNYSIQKTKKIYVFFHICCIYNYAEIVHTMIQSMQDSGLYDECEEIYYALLGDPTDSFLLLLKTYKKMKCVYTSPDITEVEYPLLTYLQEFSHTQDAYIFYCHTKGVSQSNDSVKIKWRERLVEKNIKEYKKCISFLNKGCDIAGCGWKEHPVDNSIRQPFSVHTHSHFSGNFWWAQSVYIRTLPSIQKRELQLHDRKDKRGWEFESYRLECEMWIGQGEKKKVGVNTDLNIDYTKDFFDQK
ncbi:MAG: hypothetical protein K9M36_00490 [Candidatus Pacebacteria bacterium]|nr:hypothetical protein [Candidatus Paceibacterota bacterium]